MHGQNVEGVEYEIDRELIFQIVDMDHVDHQRGDLRPTAVRPILDLHIASPQRRELSSLHPYLQF